MCFTLGEGSLVWCNMSLSSGGRYSTPHRSLHVCVFHFVLDVTFSPHLQVVNSVGEDGLFLVFVWCFVRDKRKRGNTPRRHAGCACRMSAGEPTTRSSSRGTTRPYCCRLLRNSTTYFVFGEITSANSLAMVPEVRCTLCSK